VLVEPPPALAPVLLLPHAASVNAIAAVIATRT